MSNGRWFDGYARRFVENGEAIERYDDRIVAYQSDSRSHQSPSGACRAWAGANAQRENLIRERTEAARQRTGGTLRRLNRYRARDRPTADRHALMRERANSTGAAAELYRLGEQRDRCREGALAVEADRNGIPNLRFAPRLERYVFREDHSLAWEALYESRDEPRRLARDRNGVREGRYRGRDGKTAHRVR